MRYAFDIDGTICTNREEVRKEKKDDTLTCRDMEPYSERIQIVNDLYDQGHEIIYWTGRGATTGISWRDLTKSQLKEWGCKYHKLSIGEKPNYELLICDKTKRIEEI